MKKVSKSREKKSKSKSFKKVKSSQKDLLQVSTEDFIIESKCGIIDIGSSFNESSNNSENNTQQRGE